jgi:hypothetical protein
MRELKIRLKNFLITNTESTLATSFQSKQTRTPLRPQITFKNIKFIHQSKLRFLGIHIKENINWGAHVRLLREEMQSSLYDKNIKGNHMPLHNEKHLLFEFSLLSKVWYYIMGWG